jgi:predicted NAD/FAD-binding protein
VRAISRASAGRSRISLNDGSCLDFDRVVVAAHGDQAFGMLEDPSDMESTLLPCFSYQKNEAVLHTDPSFMPVTRRCWASWNYRVEPGPGKDHRYSTHYWMNSLQGVSNRKQYFVSINPPSEPAAGTILHRLSYEHPLFDLKAAAAQTRLPELHADGIHTGRYFCGAWQRHGFHEDGLWSATEACRHILGRDPWQ